MTFKRLFFDIETSPNIGFFWSAGYKLNISPENIIQERAVICVCYKWAHEKQVKYLTWDKGDDKELLEKFMQIMNSADEVIGQNSDNFDIKWLRTRCLKHNIPAYPEYQSVDTYKLAKKYFRFNSNKLDYMSSFMGFGNKLKTGYNLWKDIVLNNDEKAMNQMVRYCKKDVMLTQKVFEKMNPFIKHKTHRAVLEGNTKLECPECGGDDVRLNGTKVSAAGVRKQVLQCKKCSKFYNIAVTHYNKLMADKENKAKI